MCTVLFPLWPCASYQSELENFVNSVCWWKDRLCIPTSQWPKNGHSEATTRMLVLKALLEVETRPFSPRVSNVAGYCILFLCYSTLKTRWLSYTKTCTLFTYWIPWLLWVFPRNFWEISEKLTTFSYQRVHFKTSEGRKSELNKLLFLWTYSLLQRHQNFTPCYAQTLNWGASLLCLFEMPLGLLKFVIKMLLSVICPLQLPIFFSLSLTFFLPWFLSLTQDHG